MLKMYVVTKGILCGDTEATCGLGEESLHCFQYFGVFFNSSELTYLLKNSSGIKDDLNILTQISWLSKGLQLQTGGDKELHVHSLKREGKCDCELSIINWVI